MAEQIPLAIPFAHDDDFVAGAANARAQVAIKRLTAGSALALIGPARSGKTTLAKSMGFAILASHQIDFVLANAQHGDYAIDGLSAALTNDADRIFHLFNAQAELGGRLLFIDEIAPGQIDIGLRDLQTRLSAIDVVAIEPPDDDLVMQLIAKYFHLRGVGVPSDALQFIGMRVARDYVSIEGLVARIDEQARITKSRVTTKLVKSVLVE